MNVMNMPAWMQRLNDSLVLEQVNEEDIILDIPAENFDEDEVTQVIPYVTMAELVYESNI